MFKPYKALAAAIALASGVIVAARAVSRPGRSC